MSQMGITVVILPRADDLYTASFLVRKGFEEHGITIASDVEEDIKVLTMSFNDADYKAQPKTVINVKGPGCKKCTSKVGRGWKEIVREEKYKEKNT